MLCSTLSSTTSVTDSAIASAASVWRAVNSRSRVAIDAKVPARGERVIGLTDDRQIVLREDMESAAVPMRTHARQPRMRSMAWTADREVAAGRDQVMDILTRPCSIASWAPVPFEVEGLKGDRLETGSRARVAGRLAGKELIFEVDVHEADEGRLRLIAHGPYL